VFLAQGKKNNIITVNSELGTNKHYNYCVFLAEGNNNIIITAPATLSPALGISSRTPGKLFGGIRQ